MVNKFQAPTVSTGLGGLLPSRVEKLVDTLTPPILPLKLWKFVPDISMFGLPPVLWNQSISFPEARLVGELTQMLAENAAMPVSPVTLDTVKP